MDSTILSLTGFTLNQEEKNTLGSSLEIKKAEENLASIHLCAKILGTKGDYYLAYATSQDVFERKFFYWYRNRFILINT